MFSAIIQPSIISLFSSTSTDPLRLYSIHSDPSLPEDSFIALVHDQPTNLTSWPPPAVPILPPLLPSSLGEDEERLGYSLDQTVLHIQSPTLPTTFIECPRPSRVPHGPQLSPASPRRGGESLGLKHHWLHIQVRSLGRDWSFEVGLVDQSGRAGVLRLSTFQKEPRLKIPSKPGSAPLLHLPLSFPIPSPHQLTAWSTIVLNLPSLIPHFTSPTLVHRDGENSDSEQQAYQRHKSWIPSGTYSHISYIRVYASCRLRRIWLSEGGPHQKMPWEFALYGTNDVTN